MTTKSASKETTSSTASATEAAKAISIPETAVVVNNYTWHTTEFGQFRIEKSRWGLYTSYNKDGLQLVTGLTEDAVLSITPMHLEANSSDYDGKFDGSKYSSSAGVKL